MESISDSAMNHAGRLPDHTFRDLRSASRARNRTRRHMEKYWHFKSPYITPSDLTSSPNQQSHYRAVCLCDGCPNQGTTDRCVFNLFPADLSTAPIAKLTKREAYEEAQMWPRPPTSHHSRRRNDCPKWNRRKHFQKTTKRGIDGKEYADDVWGVEQEEQWLSLLSIGERYCFFGQDREGFEGCTDDYGEFLRKGVDGGYESGEEGKEREWFWHRNYDGDWFRATWKMHYWGYCRCEDDLIDRIECAGSARVEYSLADWLGGEYLEDDEGEEVEEGWETWGWDDESPGDWYSEDVDWDVVSTASSEPSEAWTEVEGLEPDVDSLL